MSLITLTADIRAKQGCVPEFIEAIRINSKSSQEDEPGCISFDVTQDITDEHHFIFHEIYDSEEAIAYHRTTEHYARWSEAVEKYVEPGSLQVVIGRRLFYRSDDQLSE